MTDHDVNLTQSEEYKALLAERKRLVWPLLILVIGVYVAFILTVAFSPASLGAPIGSGVTSVGITIGVGIILFMFALTLYYVRQANRKIEPLIAKLHTLAGGQS